MTVSAPWFIYSCILSQDKKKANKINTKKMAVFRPPKDQKMDTNSIPCDSKNAITKINLHDAGVKNESNFLSGTIYRQSGNLLVIKQVAKTVAFGIGNHVKRGCVEFFSCSSASRMRVYLRECVAEYSVFITLTYPCGFSSDGKRSKEHLRRFLQELRRYHERNGVDMSRYSTFWFLEFQERGAPHYHLFSTNPVPHQWIARRWYEIVASEDPRHLSAGTSVEAFKSGRHGISSYATKYALKETQKTVPEKYQNVGRFWGVSGLKRTKAAALLFQPSDLKSASVQRAKNKIDTLVKDAVSEERATVIVRKPGVAVIYLKGSSSISILAARIYLADALLSAHREVIDRPYIGSIDMAMDTEDIIRQGA